MCCSLPVLELFYVDVIYYIIIITKLIIVRHGVIDHTDEILLNVSSFEFRVSLFKFDSSLE